MAINDTAPTTILGAIDERLIGIWFAPLIGGDIVVSLSRQPDGSLMLRERIEIFASGVAPAHISRFTKVFAPDEQEKAEGEILTFCIRTLGEMGLADPATKVSVMLMGDYASPERGEVHCEASAIPEAQVRTATDLLKGLLERSGLRIEALEARGPREAVARTRHDGATRTVTAEIAEESSGLWAKYGVKALVACLRIRGGDETSARALGYERQGDEIAWLNESSPARERSLSDSLLRRWYLADEEMQAQLVVLYPQISRLEGPKSQSLSDVQEYLSKRFEEMKAFFASEGANASSNPGYFFFCEDGNYLASLSMNLNPRGQLAFRTMHRNFVRDFARKHNAYGVGILADMWVASESCPDGTLPSDDLLRREALTIHIRVREGNACWSRSCFYERRNGKIVWQATPKGWVEGREVYAIPVWWTDTHAVQGN